MEKIQRCINRHRLLEYPVPIRGIMTDRCPGCGSKLDIGGLPISIGGYDMYCTTCGNIWHIN